MNKRFPPRLYVIASNYRKFLGAAFKAKVTCSFVAGPIAWKVYFLFLAVPAELERRCRSSLPSFFVAKGSQLVRSLFFLCSSS